MDLVLQPVLNKFALVYLRDIIITSNSVEENIEYLTKVFTFLQQAGLIIKMEKCAFGRKEIKHLGFKLTQEDQFIPNFAKLAELLYKLKRKKVTFVWDSEAQKSYERLKMVLT